MNQYKMCSRCLLDTTVKSISFDDNGVCNFCHSHDRLLEYYSQNDYIRKKNFDNLINNIKINGINKQYDCIVGVSGGTDSIYTLYMAVKSGLKPLAVYMDNGWGTNIATENIQNAIKKLNVDLITYTIDKTEFIALQKAFLKAAVPCIDVPADVAILSVLYKIAAEKNIKFILSGVSFITEGTVPKEWSYIDGTYIKTVNKLFGNSMLKNYPNLTITKILYYTFVKGIKQIPFTNFFHYDKNEARELLNKELNWQYYGGHHYENIFTFWAIGWYLINKFGIDKRKVSLSGPVRMGRLSKDEALKIISIQPPIDNDTTAYILQELKLSKEEFDNIIASPNKSYLDYKTSYNLIRKAKPLIKFLIDKNILTPVIYEKYLGY